MLRPSATLSFALLTLTALGSSACGGSVEDSDHSSGGVGGDGGTGGTGGSVGGQATGGAASGGESASGGGNGCPAMPASRALPLVAMFFAGPDPGPCSSTTDGALSEYFYEDGLPMGSTGSEPSSYERDPDGKIISMTTDFFVDTFEWGDGEVTQSNEFQLVVFQLDDLGYPRSAQVTPLATNSLGGEYTYEWVDCRLDRLLRPDGTSRSYHYDDAGHVIQVDHGTHVVDYDYGCW